MAGCSERLPVEGTPDSSLQLRLGAPDYGVEVKSVSSDPNNPGSWTSWERAVDGRYIYRATAFILQGNRLVAHKDIQLQGEAKEAVIDFEANFTHGSYTLMVVANYSAFEAEDGANGVKRYEGLTDFSSVVDQILSNGAMDNFKETYSSSFFNYKIASVNGLCKRVPQPLTLVKEIELHPGTNVISGELLRTYSRVRICVENNSDEVLSISSMDFCDIFTQKSAYIFDGQGFLQERIAPDVTSADALTQFAGSEDEPMAVPAKGSSVVFDAYILESSQNSASEEYNYTLSMQYGATKSFKLASTSAINKQENIKAGYYLIYNKQSNRFLVAGTNSVNSSSLTLSQNMTLSEQYIWAFDNTGLSANTYYIGTHSAFESGQTTYYMSSPTAAQVVLGANKNNNFTTENISVTGDSGIAFKANSTPNYYLSSDGSNVLGHSKLGNNNTSKKRAMFVLYPVEAPKASSIVVPVRTIDNATGQAFDVTQIKRNDFINAVVKVSYSKNQGHFIFEVQSWNSGGGDVEFN
ncbi:MAG: hypothetical protein IKU18_06415 [Bacteroidales bacterium]|nr:hypothetical protein [Bacteroidales bacterium]